VIAVPTDVTQPEPCQQLIEQAITAFGQIDVLVNNAGISMLTPLVRLQTSIFEQVMQVNYLGAVYCTHYALPISKPIEDFWAISSLCGKPQFPLIQVMLQVNTPCKASLILSALSYGKWSGCVGCVTGVCCNRYPTKGFRADGQPLGQSPRDESNMTVEECVHQIVWAMERRKREHIMTLKGKVTPWAKLILPELVDRIAAYAARATTSAEK